MPDLLIKDVPAVLIDKLLAKAQLHGSTVDRTAIDCLNRQLSPTIKTPTQVQEVLEEIRSHRKKMKNIYLTDDELEAAINEGRP